MFKAQELIVDNRFFLLGLDHLYREAMKEHESDKLLTCAEEVAKKLEVPPTDVPIEGYYNESPELTRYFRLMRALQEVEIAREAEVIKLKSYNRLKQVTASPIFGLSAERNTMFPGGRDALYCALDCTMVDNWNVPHLVEAAYRAAVGSDDYSLVTLSVLAKDPVVIAACRETVVLYAEVYFSGAGPAPRYKYVWRVDEIIEKRARLFVSTFNKLMGESLPKPCAAKAKQFYLASKNINFEGRCVRIGADDSIRPVRHYHWAITFQQGEGYVVNDFWDTDLWTTQRYQAQQEPEL